MKANDSKDNPYKLKKVFKSYKQRMDAYDKLPKELRLLAAYAPDNVMFNSIENTSIEYLTDLYWRKFNTFIPLQSDPIKRP